MSICRNCFKKGDHSTHDFNMFLSQAGGACDCGDTSVMKAEGFCSDHGINNSTNKSPVPNDLMAVAEAVMPQLLLRLLRHFRDSDTEENAKQCDEYIGMLMELNNMGELMRRVMTKALINPQLYKELVEPPLFEDLNSQEYWKLSKQRYDEAVRLFPRYNDKTHKNIDKINLKKISVVDLTLQKNTNILLPSVKPSIMRHSWKNSFSGRLS